MLEKRKKAVYASVWTFFMVVACYLTVTASSSRSSGSPLPLESYVLLAAEIVLVAASLIILAFVLKLRRLHPSSPVKLAKVKKAFAATLLTMVLASATYATTLYLASFISPTVIVERIQGVFQYSNDTTTWVDAYDGYKVSNMSWYVRFNVTSAFQGTVNITWTLQCYNGTCWISTNVAVTSSNVALSGNGSQIIYASQDGNANGNKNWADENGVWRDELRSYTSFRIKVDFYEGA